LDAGKYSFLIHRTTSVGNALRSQNSEKLHTYIFFDVEQISNFKWAQNATSQNGGDTVRIVPIAHRQDHSAIPPATPGGRGQSCRLVRVVKNHGFFRKKKKKTVFCVFC
jgi:hypothetical protein